MKNLPNLASGARLVPSASTKADMRRSTRRPFRSRTSRCLCLRVPLCLRCFRADASASAVGSAVGSAAAVGAGSDGSGGGASFGILNPPDAGFAGGGASSGASPDMLGVEGAPRERAKGARACATRGMGNQGSSVRAGRAVMSGYEHYL